MKTKLIMLSLIFLFSGYSAEAQLLKKLKNAVKQGIDAVDGEDKENEEKTAGDDRDRETSAPADEKTAAAGMPMGMEEIPAPPDNNVQLPDSYNFSYRATLRIENSQGTVEPVFYLQPDADYYARKQTNQGLTEYLVLDNQIDMAVLFGEFEGEKRRVHNYINLQTKATLIGAYRDMPQKEPLKTLESKTIQGYHCQGYQISTEEGITQLWITDEAPASLFSTMLASRADEPGTPFNKNSMIMEVSFTSAQEPEKNYQMVCAGLQPETLVLNKEDYHEDL